MRAHYLQHVPFEGLGSLEELLRDAGCEIGCTRLFAGDAFPAVESLDLLIIMGGPMSVNDEQEHFWLGAEKVFINRAIEAGVPVLGVCLGAQLIASALGAKVYPGPEKEIGWLPVQGVSSEKEGVFPFPERLKVFQWHGETFDLPEGATLLASSDVCPNQAFQYRDRVIALQFHLETTAASAQSMVEHCGDELIPADHVQSAERILAATDADYAAIRKVMRDLVAYLMS